MVFLDDDTEISPYTLYEFWHGFQELPTAGMLFARIYNAERRQELDDCGSWLTPSGFLYARASNGHITHDELMRPVRCLASKSAGCAIKRSVFYAAGGFDASYFILGEETDLAWRVWLQGAEVWYWPFAVLWHAFDTTAKRTVDYYTLERIHRFGARNYIALLCTNLGALRLWLVLPGHVCGWLLAIVCFAVRGDRPRATLVSRGLWDALSRLPRTLAKRHTVQARRLRSDHDLMPLIRRRVPLSYYVTRLRRYVVSCLHG